MAVGMLLKMYVMEEFVEVGAVVMDVAGDPEIAFLGEDDDLLLPERAKTVFVRRDVENFDDIVR
jgi:hypothetical protein